MARIHEGKKQSEIVDEVLKIANKCPFKSTLTKCRHTSILDMPETSLSELWADVLFLGRTAPVVETVYEVSRQEFELLCNRVESIEQVVFRPDLVAKIEIDNIFGLCKSYIEKISSMDIVNKIMLVEDEDETTCWTIIDAPPFEDSLREPIYEAQLEILRSVDDDIPLDFHVLNISEVPTPEKLEEIIPSDAQIIWQR
jgi:hypothetical protein